MKYLFAWALAVVAPSMFPFWLYMTLPEIATILATIGFLGYQTGNIWRHDKTQLVWVLLGAILWLFIIWRFYIVLDTLFQSLLFFALVTLNLFIILKNEYRVWSRIVFLDMTVCFCLCHVLAPTRRDHEVIIANIGILLLILIAYWIAYKKEILTKT